MPRTGKLFAIVLFVLFAAGSASASIANVYVAQSAAGGNTGVDCADAFAVTFFNTAGNWGAGGSQIGPGTTVHLCGTFTVAGGVSNNMLTVQGSGSSGNPITLLFETGANFTSPYWGVYGAIYLNGQQWITINGGTNGLIKDTANGTGLGNAADSVGIYGGDPGSVDNTGLVVENLTIANLYVHTSPSDTAVDQTNVRCISFVGSNISIHDNVMHDVGWCLLHYFDNGNGNVSVYNNKIYNIDHAYVLASLYTVGGGSSGPFSFHDNYVHDYENWDTTTNNYHHDGIHCFTAGSAPHITAFNIYNNLFTTVGNMTGHVYLEGNPGTPCMDSTSVANIYNNVFIDTDTSLTYGGLVPLDSDGVMNVYNNTVIGDGIPTEGTACFFAAAVNVGSQTMNFRNNVVTGCQLLVGIAASTRTVNHNIYANTDTSNTFVCGATLYDFSQFASWQSCVGDTNSSYHASAGLNSSGVPQVGSAVIGAGANLTSLGITALDSDTSAGNSRTPVARPSSGAWDSGAYQSGGGGPLPPIGVTIIIAQ